ncbi:MAG: hypothetical protein LBL82_00245 [Oscillospiraceae bacterium]|nr:hypothetical protein [Oscillospiraceae bacterium]
MKKDFTRDYTTEIFRLYAQQGCPTYEQAKIYAENNPPLLLDILAAQKTIELLERGEKSHIVTALREVYFKYPSQPLRAGDISSRVCSYALSVPTDERTVYRWLHEARLLCASLRGLRT